MPVTGAIVPRTTVSPNFGTAVVQVIGPNPTRQSLIVFNPNAVTIAFGPLDLQPVINGAGIQLPTLTGIQLFGWTAGVNMIAASGIANVATLLEF